MKKIINASFLMFSSWACASNPVAFTGNVPVEVPVSKPGLVTTTKTVMLSQLKLSTETQHFIQKQLKHYRPNQSRAFIRGELPSRLNLGMQGTPVLDQGLHGSCVTFAVTAALDAALGAGDYVSQLCSLELGSYLALHDQLPLSGWDGTYGSLLLDQVMKYGIIPQTYQHLFGCAGVKEYPVGVETETGQPMSDEEYLEHSIPVHKVLGYKSLLTAEDMISAEEKVSLIDQMKQELAKGNRLAIGIMLDGKIGSAGAKGKYKVDNDTWMLTHDIVVHLAHDEIQAGHELVVTGYDDDVQVKDANGASNQGVFILRNSWSDEVGDKGTYYVTYDYLQYLIIEAHSIYVNRE